MTPLGLGPRHCRDALERYRSSLAAVAHSLTAADAVGPARGTLVLLDELAERVEVDTLSRHGVGASHMTRAEAAVFAPVVGRLRTSLEELSRQPPGAPWLPVLDQMDQWLVDADMKLAIWERRIG